MSEDRETHQIVTPVKGHVVVVKSWINGREKQKIDGASFKNITSEGEGETLRPKMSETMLADQEDATIEAIVISVDGNEVDVVNQVLDMRSKDYEFIVSQCDKIVKGDLDPKDEKSLETSTTKSLPTTEESSATPSSP